MPSRLSICPICETTTVVIWCNDFIPSMSINAQYLNQAAVHWTCLTCLNHYRSDGLGNTCPNLNCPGRERTCTGQVSKWTWKDGAGVYWFSEFYNTL
ncbi:hypothetical protein LMH87_002977 [Akanthomyces muscarius]|uniref:Uncharacterized protein n=1 Tax=Akanthomyces muscarius TaxID=2231603 RepID=A0A9W8Q853_AKAMU|nr:hypothetical protein LMH87_002977 [Akanthomyces muscarius]KAJ4148512.1 hypothetical protein LMH87_002977 [Akanthomyces muscarius]